MDIPEEFSDCARDVLAMVDAFMLVERSTAMEEMQRGLGNYRVLSQHADLRGCLRVAVMLVAASWRTTSIRLAEANGTSEDAELARIMTLFREKLESLG